jgi:ABC-type phosphate/phosphonate transport system permease subunit
MGHSLVWLLQWPVRAAILLLIIMIVMTSEYLSGYVRKWTQ